MMVGSKKRKGGRELGGVPGTCVGQKVRASDDLPTGMKPEGIALRRGAGLDGDGDKGKGEFSQIQIPLN